MLRLVIPLILFSCLLPHVTSAQLDDFNDSPLLREQTYRQSEVLIEVLGNGLLLSFQYDMRFYRNRDDGFGYRFGIGGGNYSAGGPLGITSNTRLLTIPLGINYLIGKGKLQVETGIGGTIYNYKRNKNEVDESGLFPKLRGWNMLESFNMGLRYHPYKGGLSVRAYWSPLYFKNKFDGTWLGVSFGFHFD